MTVLFADITGSTALGEWLDPEAVRELLASHFGAAREAIERHGGTVEKFIGDAVMAVFGLPDAHEDDALRAVRASLEIQAAAARLNASEEAVAALQIRIGLNSGDVVAGDPASGETLVTGDTVNTAARLEQAAEPGEILLGGLTHELVSGYVDTEPSAPIHAKGKADPVTAHRVRGLTRSGRRGGRSALVGRESEVGRVREAWAGAIHHAEPRAVALIAPAGVGKSRILAAAADAFRDLGRIEGGRCLPYGEAITYWPIREIVLGAIASRDDESPAAARARLTSALAGEPDGLLVERRLASALGLSDEPSTRPEVFWAVRRFLETLARARPMLLFVEDVHWAEPTLLDLLDDVVANTAGAALTLVITARAEVLDGRPEWGTQDRWSRLRLEPLGPAAAEALLLAQPGGGALDADLRERVLAVAEGNPLFVEELIGVLRDRAILIQQDGAWKVSATAHDVVLPATIRALLAARLDHLPLPERITSERASVIGRTFEEDALAELDDPPLVQALRERLQALMAKELIEAADSDLGGGDAFRFRHVLIRDAAYDALAKRERARLHQRFAEWLLRTIGTRAGEFDEVIGFHLEQAVRYQRELGRVAEKLAPLAAHGARHLRRAAWAAWRRDDPRATMSLVTRSLGVAPQGDPARGWDLRLLWTVERVLGLHERARRHLAEAEATLAVTADARLARRLRLDRSFTAWREAKAAGFEELQAVAPAVLAEAEADGDPGAMALALRALGYMRLSQGDSVGEFELQRRALALAEAAGEELEARNLRVLIANRIFQLPMPVPEALDRIEAMLATTGDDQRIHLMLLLGRAYLEGVDDRIEDARADLKAAWQIGQRLGVLHPDLTADWAGVTVVVETLASNPARAEEIGRWSVNELEPVDDHWHLASVYANLARSILGQRARLNPQRLAEAERLVSLSVAIAASDDPEEMADLGLARALLLSAQGDHDTAIELAATSVEAMGTSAHADYRAGALIDQVSVLMAAGRHELAATAAAEIRQVIAPRQARAFVRVATELERLARRAV